MERVAKAAEELMELIRQTGERDRAKYLAMARDIKLWGQACSQQ